MQLARLLTETVDYFVQGLSCFIGPHAGDVEVPDAGHLGGVFCQVVPLIEEVYRLLRGRVLILGSGHRSDVYPPSVLHLDSDYVL